jgi:hypothetical protein
MNPPRAIVLSLADHFEELIGIVQGNLINMKTSAAHLARLAYECTNSAGLTEYPANSFEEGRAHKIRRNLLFLARLVSAAHFLAAMARKLLQFQDLRICSRTPPDLVSFGIQFCVLSQEAWQRLIDQPLSAAHDSVPQPFDDAMRRINSQGLASHAGIQLALHYELLPDLTPMLTH